MTKLDDARVLINQIDEEMRELFERRMKAVEMVINYKMENNLPIFDAIREAEVIKRNIEKMEDDNLKVYYHDYIEMVMEISKNYQQAIIESKKGN